MRKLIWVFWIFMALAALGNLIGGTDTPVSSKVDSNSTSTRTMYVTASALNLREAPSLDGRILAKLPRNTRVNAGERRNGWVLISVNQNVGWVSDDYLSSTLIAPARSAPKQRTQNRQTVLSSGPSCRPRKTCGQIRSCSDAYYYLRNCSWGGRLDRDNDGVPCESICR